MDELGAVDSAAAALLIQMRVIFRKIIRVDPDSILFLDAANRPATAWKFQDESGKWSVQVDPGFPAMPD